MTFADIVGGQRLFIDANTFVYALAPEPTLGPPCFELLERIRRNEIEGVLSTHVFSDVSHRLMSLEACATFAWPYAGIANRLKRHPADVAKLHKFRQAMDEIVALGVQVVSPTISDLLLAGDLSRQHGLLSGDALILAIMQRQSLTGLASNDADFDRVPEIVRYSPI